MSNFPKTLEPQFETKRGAKKAKIVKKLLDKEVIFEMVKIIRKGKQIREKENEKNVSVCGGL